MTTPRNLSSRYELGEILGFGGMSEVHLARDVRLGRDVAIKILRADLARDPTFYERFRREAQNAAALNHRSIVAVYDTAEAETEAGPLPYIVMEYVDGDTLRDMLRAGGPFDPVYAAEIIADVCAALDFSHRNGIIHRDVKPANIMINRAGDVKVMDFGIARAIADAANPMTQTSAVIGTAQYLSPEQASGEQVDARSDVYSLGCVLFEILTGRAPFIGDSPVAIAYQHVGQEPPVPSSINPDIPRELDDIILGALTKDRQDRYQTAADMGNDLRRFAGHPPMKSGGATRQPPVAPEERPTELIKKNGNIHQRFDGEGKPAAPARKGHALAASLWSIAVVLVLGIVGTFLWVAGPGASQAAGIAVPDVTGMTQVVAQQTLLNAGLKISTTEKADADAEPGLVLSTSPAAGAEVSSGDTVLLEISAGPEQVKVPRLAGLTRDEAQAALDDAGLLMASKVEKAPSDEDDLDKVVEQKPAPGEKVEPNSEVAITLGGGQEDARVPDVTGQREELAKETLEDAGFDVRVVEVNSGTSKGLVVATDPVGGAEAKTGDTIELQVSNGEGISMPSLIGMSTSQAKATLKSLGWKGSIFESKELNLSQVDKIVRQNPGVGETIAVDEDITLVVGKLFG